MDRFISLFYFLVYNEDEANYYWHNYGNECCLKFGFYTLLVCALLVTFFYYFYWSNVKIQKHASTKSWMKVGLVGMLITFVMTEIVVANRCDQLEGMDAYIGESGCDILVFSLYNGIIGFAICYLLFSTALQLLSKNAKNIPWIFYRK